MQENEGETRRETTDEHTQTPQKHRRESWEHGARTNGDQAAGDEVMEDMWQMSLSV